MEDAMTPFARFAPVVAGLVLLLDITPSWGQGQTYNPTASDNDGNTAGGSDALQQVQTGSDNTAFGRATLSNALNASNNTAVGADALGLNSTGNNNTAGGASALSNIHTGNLNVALGFQGLQNNTDGNSNTAVGAKALKKTQGTKNIGIGYQAGVTLQTGNNNIYIGNQGAGDESQTIRIGTAQTGTFIAGISAASVGDAQVMVDTTTGQLGIVTSSARYKQAIEAIANRSEGLLKLRPVTFVYKDDASGAPRYGLIAEEVATVYPELVSRTAAGEVQTVKYHELTPMLLNELQREHQARQQESARVAALETQLVALQALVAGRLGQSASQDGPGDSPR